MARPFAYSDFLILATGRAKSRYPFLVLGFAATADDGARCHTDTECAKLCRINDVNCDGGPE